MRVLITGASSGIGSRLATAFAPGNDLYVTGRDAGRLHATADRCRLAGAFRVSEMPLDLSCGPAPLLGFLDGSPVDLVIWAASSTSRLRDEQIPAASLAAHFTSDLTTPIESIRRLAEAFPGRPLSVLFISSILAVLPSPRRAIYGRLKELQEHALRRLESEHPSVRLTVFRIARVVDPDRDSRSAEAIARLGASAVAEHRATVTYGVSGRLLYAIYSALPLLFHGLMQLRRAAQRLQTRT